MAVYKGSITVTQSIGRATHDVQSMAQVKFNVIRLDALTLTDTTTGLSFGRTSPYFVYVDSIIPYSYDRIAGGTNSNVGGAQWNGSGYDVSSRLAPPKRTSYSVDVCRSPITVSVVDSTGVLVSTLGVGAAHIAVSISLWEYPIDQVVSAVY